MQLRHHRVPHAAQRKRIDLLGARVPEAPALKGALVYQLLSSWRTADMHKEVTHKTRAEQQP